MSLELVLVCVVVGAGTYLFRALPTQLNRRPGAGARFGGPVGAFLGSVGVAAVTALLVQSLGGVAVPSAGQGLLQGIMPERLAAGVLAAFGLLVTFGIFRWKGSVALATLAGAVAYGLAWWALA